MTSKRNEAKKTKTLFEMRDAVKRSMKKSYVRTALLELIDNELDKFQNPNSQSMTLRIEKKEWLKIKDCVNRKREFNGN